MTVILPSQQRRDIGANWTSVNPILFDGQIGINKTTGQIKFGDGVTAWNALGYWSSGVAWGAITGTLADQADLQTALNGKQAAGSYAASVHTHTIANVTGLQAALDGKAASAHTHVIADTTGLQAALDTKQPAGSYAAAAHTHAQADVTGLVAALAAKEPTIAAGLAAQYWRGDKTWQTLDKAAVGLGNVDNTSDANKPISTAVTTAMAGKANSVHTHAQADVTGLVSALAAKSDTSHTHANATTGAAGFMADADKTKLDGISAGATVNATDAALRDRATHTGSQTASTISDFAETVDDRVAALLVAGTNITLTYNDAGNTLTIDATGGGATNLALSYIAIGGI